MPIAITTFGSGTKTILTRAQRRTELRRQLRDGETNQLWADDACNSALNEALAYTHLRYPGTQRVKIVADGNRAYRLPTDCMAIKRVYVQDGTTGTTAVPPEEQNNWEQIKGFDTDYITPTANAYDSILVLDQAWSAPNLILVVYAPIPAQWGDAGDVSYDNTAIDLAPDEGTDRFAELLFYAAARTAAYRWAMAQLPGAGSEDYGREYAAAMQERDKLTLMISGPRETLRLTTGIFG